MPDTTPMPAATITLDGVAHEFPVVAGSEQEKGIDISKLRSATGYITLDDGYGNTGSCESAITYIDGDKGILRYRGYRSSNWRKNPLRRDGLPHHERRAAHARPARALFRLLTRNEMITTSSKHHLGLSHVRAPHGDPFGHGQRPQLLLPFSFRSTTRQFEQAAAGLSPRCAPSPFSYKKSIGEPFIYPDPALRSAPFLHMMFHPRRDYALDPDVVHAWT